MYVQGVGTQSAYNLGAGDPNLLSISTSSTVYTSFFPILASHTYRITYYTNSTNPWNRAGMSVNSWKLDDLGNVSVTMDINNVLFLIRTAAPSVINLMGKLAMPSMSHGQIIRFKDYGSYMSQCNVQLTDSLNNVFDSSSTTVTLSTNNMSKLYCYYGSSTNGNYFSL